MCCTPHGRAAQTVFGHCDTVAVTNWAPPFICSFKTSWLFLRFLFMGPCVYSLSDQRFNLNVYTVLFLTVIEPVFCHLPTSESSGW